MVAHRGKVEHSTEGGPYVGKRCSLSQGGGPGTWNKENMSVYRYICQYTYMYILYVLNFI